MTFDKNDLKFAFAAVLVFLFINFLCRSAFFSLFGSEPSWSDIPSWLLGSKGTASEIITLKYRLLPSRRFLLFLPALTATISSFFAYFIAHFLTRKRAFEKMHMSIAIVWFGLLAVGTFLFLGSTPDSQGRPDLLLKSIFIPEFAVFFGWIIKRQFDLKNKTH